MTLVPYSHCYLTCCVCRLLKDVGAACTEANDTVKYLKPLRKYLEKLNSMDDFVALIELFKPMFHTVLLIWKHSGFYNTSAKMVTLIREMCNDLIMQACKFAPGQIHLFDSVQSVQPNLVFAMTVLSPAGPETAMSTFLCSSCLYHVAAEFTMLVIYRTPTFPHNTAAS